MSTKKVVWNEKVSATEFNILYPRTVAEQVVLNNTINNNLGIDVDSRLEAALEHISDTDKRIRAQGTSTGNVEALELSVPVFVLIDGIMARVKIHTDAAEGATLNVNHTGAKPIVRIDGQPINLILKQGTWCIFIYSSTLDSWVFEGWSTKTTVKSAIYTETGSWTVPANVTSVDVFIMGGGGGAGGNLTYDTGYTSFGGGGGAGRLKKQQLTVTPGQSITVTVGTGGAAGVDRTGSGSETGGVGSNGGTTSFGTLLSVTGGNGGTGGSVAQGGNGGAGSAGGGGGSNRSGGSSGSGGSGGNGDYCGGGGAAASANTSVKGGNGGTYGGGGGSMVGTRATGGQYGGAGGVTGSNLSAVAGTNTTAMSLDFIGEGKAGTNGITKYDDTGSLRYGGGAGGGGYGGDGGDGGNGEKSLDFSADTYGASGGGGGYGGNGYGSSDNIGHGGGGGGYGGDATGSGGGGYGASNFGRGGNSASNDSTDRAGKSGICIITWTAQEA